MGAIKKNFNPDEVGVLAVLAGNDMILMCHTPGIPGAGDRRHPQGCSGRRHRRVQN
ncbi:hypothetical protein ACFTAO_22515 [Paenibacillus rhizoplanae]